MLSIVTTAIAAMRTSEVTDQEEKVDGSVEPRNIRKARGRTCYSLILTLST